MRPQPHTSPRAIRPRSSACTDACAHTSPCAVAPRRWSAWAARAWSGWRCCMGCAPWGRGWARCGCAQVVQSGRNSGERGARLNTVCCGRCAVCEGCAGATGTTSEHTRISSSTSSHISHIAPLQLAYGAHMRWPRRALPVWGRAVYRAPGATAPHEPGRTVPPHARTHACTHSGR